jgi:hypothetical protein
MKKRLLLAGVLSLFMAVAANAQSFHYGLKASLLFSTIQGRGLKSSYPPGFQGGAFAEWDFKKHWGIQPEVLFSQSSARKGSDFNGSYVTEHNTSAREKIKISAITVPLMIRYTPIKELTLNLGAQYSYMFFIDENLIKGNRDAFKKADIGGVAGIQVNLANVRFYGRYVMGLTNLNDIDDRFTWKSQQISIGMGLTIK